MSLWERVYALSALAGLGYSAYRAIEDHLMVTKWLYGDLQNYFTAYLTSCPDADFLVSEGKAYRGGVDWTPSLSYDYSLYNVLGYPEATVMYKGYPLWLKGNEGSEYTPQTLTVRFFRGTIDFEDLLCKVLQREVEDRQSRVCSTVSEYRGEGEELRVSGYGKVVASSVSGDISRMELKRLRDFPRRSLTVRRPSSLDQVFLTPAQLDLFRDMEKWIRDREWYQERRLTWKRGYLLYGPPGTGKTSFLRSAAEKLGLDVHLFYLPTMTDELLVKAWEKLQSDYPYSPKMIILEELDRAFQLTEHGQPGITWPTLLNLLDGFNQAEGSMICVTTNHPDRLDEALAIQREGKVEVRPGRIDKACYFSTLTWQQAEAVAKVLVGPDEDLSQFLPKLEGKTVAQVKELCVQEAYRRRDGLPEDAVVLTSVPESGSVFQRRK